MSEDWTNIEEGRTCNHGHRHLRQRAHKPQAHIGQLAQIVHVRGGGSSREPVTPTYHSPRRQGVSVIDLGNKGEHGGQQDGQGHTDGPLEAHWLLRKKGGGVSESMGKGDWKAGTP